MQEATSSWSPEVEEEDVRQMKAAKIFNLASRLQINLQGCSNTEEFRDRVLLHLRLQKGQHYDLEREFGQACGEASDNTRQTLDRLLDTVQMAITDLSPNVEHALRIDSGGSDHTAPLVQQIQGRRHSLQTSDRSVIVAGETNAGKSTFLNLLLGMDVLPTSIFSCTAAVCKLHYSPTFKVTVYYSQQATQQQQEEEEEGSQQKGSLRKGSKEKEKKEDGGSEEGSHEFSESPRKGSQRKGSQSRKGSMQKVSEEEEEGSRQKGSAEEEEEDEEESPQEFSRSFLRKGSQRKGSREEGSQRKGSREEGSQRKGSREGGSQRKSSGSREGSLRKISEVGSSLFPDAQSTKEWLEKTVAVKNEELREKGLDITSIHVFLPAAILQSGVTLVDTPGIGEREAMTRCTMDYIKRHSAAAYLYVIKTDNAGGIHEDRLLDFLRAILHHNDRSGADPFNHSAAMFVCNRWDQVPADQRQRVQDNALSRLKDVWPRFEPRQAFFMSSTQAQMHIDADPGYITQEYELVLRGLKDMFGLSRANMVNQHYRWLKHFLHDSTTFLQTALHHCALSDEQLMARFKTARQRIQALELRTAATTRQLRQHVQRAMQQLCDSMREILQDRDVRRELMDWRHRILPLNPTTYSNEEVQRWQEEVDTTIMRRIMETVDKHVTEKGLDKDLHNSLRTTFQEELKLVDEDLNTILNDMTDNASLSSSTSSSSSSSTCMSTDSEDEHAQQLLRVYRERDQFRLGKLKRVSQVTRSLSAASASPDDIISAVPKMKVRRMMAKMLGPLATLGKKMQKMRRTSLFLNNPQQYMEERTDKMVGVVVDREGQACLHQMADKYREKLDSFISDVEKSIPMFIANSQQQMEDIKLNRRSYLSQRKELVTLMENLEPVRHLSQGYGALYIRDLTADNICFVLDAELRKESITVNVKEPEHKHKLARDSGLGRSQSRKSSTGSGSWVTTTGGSLWSTFRRGNATFGTHEKDLMGRTYIQPLEEHSLIREIARLRCLRCEDLAPFLGMTRVEDLAVFLFIGDLQSARHMLSRGFQQPSQSVPRLLEGTVRGLHYLHREGLVHMELSLDTIMVNSDGEVRLCGSCLPRRARLPPDANHICADPFVCLSPEVLRDELYIAEDDVYSFGLLVWETCLEDKPYRLYRHTLNLQEFRAQVHPSSMLGMDACHDASENMAAILRGCLLPARGLRIKMEELKDRVHELRSDPLVSALSSAHRRQHVLNRPMRRTSSGENPNIVSFSSHV